MNLNIRKWIYQLLNDNFGADVIYRTGTSHLVISCLLCRLVVYCANSHISLYELYVEVTSVGKY
jgi:hypothetical protein